MPGAGVAAAGCCTDYTPWKKSLTDARSCPILRPDGGIQVTWGDSMKHRHARAIQLFIWALITTGASTSFAGDETFTRRTYRLGDTISQVASTPYPDEQDWPGGKLFFSSDQTVVWGTDGWVPIAEIREAMHASWKKDQFANWVPIKDIQEILPFEFTPEELARTIHEFQHDRRFGPLMAAMRRPAGSCACG